MKRLHVILFWPAALLGLLWSANPFSGPILLPEAPSPVAARATSSNQTVCVDVQLTPGEPSAEVRVPGFDPSQGNLQTVILRSEGTLTAEIESRQLRHASNRLLFSAGLSYQLPNGEERSLELELDEEINRRSDAQMQRGIQHYTERQSVVSTPVEGGLHAFIDGGDLLIPVEASDLIDFKGGNARVFSSVEARLCFEYRYEAN